MRNGAVRSQAASSRRQGGADEKDDEKEGGDDLSLVNKVTATETMRRVRSWRDIVAREAKHNPGRTAAISLGVGYVLGGGLFSALTGRLVGTGLKLGFRLALVPFVTQSLVAMGENLMMRGGSDDDEDDAAPRRSDRNQKNSSEQKETHS